jgi:hypothetical protein
MVAVVWLLAAVTGTTVIVVCDRGIYSAKFLLGALKVYIDPTGAFAGISITNAASILNPEYEPNPSIRAEMICAPLDPSHPMI